MQRAVGFFPFLWSSCGTAAGGRNGLRRGAGGLAGGSPSRGDAEGSMVLLLPQPEHRLARLPVGRGSLRPPSSPPPFTAADPASQRNLRHNHRTFFHFFLLALFGSPDSVLQAGSRSDPEVNACGWAFPSWAGISSLISGKRCVRDLFRRHIWCILLRKS